MADLVGFGVAIATGMQFVENFPERTIKSLLIPLMQEDGRAGNCVDCMKFSVATYFIMDYNLLKLVRSFLVFYVRTFFR